MDVPTTFTKTADLAAPDLDAFVQEWAKQSADSLNRARKLKDPWKYDRKGKNRAEVSSGSPGLPFLITGTKRHFIQGNPTLHFLIGTQEVFAKRVDHPGMLADARLQDAIGDIPFDGLDLLDRMIGNVS